MQYKCTVCGDSIPGEMMIFRAHTEKHIVELIKTDHPEWTEADGVCRKCLEYYQKEIDGSVFKDAACAKRLRKINRLVNWIKNLFGRKV
jgi:hypothetical protein